MYMILSLVFIIVIALIIASMSFISAKETEIDTNYMEEIRFMQSEFPGTNTAQILIMVDRITAKTVLEEDILLMTEELVDAVSDVAGVKSVTSVLDLGSTKEGILSRPLEERVGGGARTLDYSWFSRTLGTERLIQRLMARVANYSLTRSLGAIIIIAITLIPIFAGVGMIKSESEQEMWMHEGDQLMVAWKVVDDEFCDYDYSTILVQSDDIRTSEIMEALERIEESVRSVPGVVKVTGINNLLKEIPADKNTLEELIAAIPKDRRETFVTDDYTAALVIIKTDTGIEETLVQQIDDAISFIETPDEATFKHASFSALFSQMDRLMEESRAETTAINLILVFTILYIFF
ncbi:MAG: hypothetical protein MASP_01303 [Candidatus Methanolliviera sp. GoM_asphalt]|nr:MAG: hypothetical protein MASP_01303 [Candidatus Methanolliviera sp. GoM_asphalt]